MTARRRAAADWQHLLRHGLAFVISGGIAFAIDAGILKLLTVAFGLHPVVARFFSICAAMTAGWLAHRRFTFRVTAPPTVAEYLRFAAVQWTVAALNYGVFVAIVLTWPALEPLLALVVSSGVAMVFSYVGMRFAAFRLGRRPRG